MHNIPWPDRIPVALSDQEIADLVRVLAKTPQGLGSHAPDVDAALLEEAMMAVCEPTASILLHLRTLLDLAQGHALSFFASANDYWRRVFDPEPSTQPAVCVTGLAGVGKSVLLRALHRLLEIHKPLAPAPLTGSTLQSSWLVRFPAFQDFKDLMRSLATSGTNPEATEPQDAPQGTVANLALAASRRARRLAVCALILDEMQFETLSADANTRVVKKLLLFRSLGPRVVYGVNYSMVHRLMRRCQEERDRLVSSPIIVLPDAASSEDWRKTIHAVLATAPYVFDFDAATAAADLHRYTFGIKRKLVGLLTLGYRGARRSGRNSVTMADLQTAYRSTDFTAHRQDVEILLAQEIEGNKKREDLYCPFPLPRPAVRPADEPIAELRREIAQRTLMASMTPDERAAVEAATRGSDKPGKRSNVIRMPRATKDGLLAAGREFFKADEAP